MYVAYYGPLQMLSDDPTNYAKEPEILEYMSKVPVTWDETKQLDGKIGDYLLVARRKGDTWYIGGMTDWSARKLKTKLDFLGSGNYKVEIFADGMNADRIGNDYKKTTKTVNKADELEIDMASGGGWVAVISPK
jgi:alpha-glucosidase